VALHEDIMELLKKKSKEPYEYINPNFLIGIEGLLCDYYECEDDDVERWIQEMFGA
jgi:hypothetical protein